MSSSGRESKRDIKGKLKDIDDVTSDKHRTMRISISTMFARRQLDHVHNESLVRVKMTLRQVNPRETKTIQAF